MTTIYKKGEKEESVEDGFNWWAFAFPTLWFLMQGMWLAAIYVLLCKILLAVMALGEDTTSMVVAASGGIVLRIFVGLKANDMFTNRLKEKGFVLVKRIKTSTRKKWLTAISVIGLMILITIFQLYRASP